MPSQTDHRPMPRSLTEAKIVVVTDGVERCRTWLSQPFKVAENRVETLRPKPSNPTQMTDQPTANVSHTFSTSFHNISDLSVRDTQ